MTEQEKNERAFPSFAHGEEPQFGLTILDYFASQALYGLLAADPQISAGNTITPQAVLAKEAYTLAQEMMKERKKRLGDE